MALTGCTDNPLYAVLQESLYGQGAGPTGWAAARLAERTDWPPLYDPARLAANTVPLAAVVYHDDTYVDAGLSLDTDRTIGAARVWATNEWEHDGLAASGDRVLARLMDLAAGRA